MVMVSSRDFNRDVSAVKRAAAIAPVVITDRGDPAYVLLSIDEYRRLAGRERSIVDWLSTDDEVDFDPTPLRVGLRDDAP